MLTYRQPGTILTEHTFSVPLDHEAPDGATIELFGREVVSYDKADADLPWLVFQQGGPGMGAPRPIGQDVWLGRALREFRVLLLDQRGTGRSTPANRQTLAGFGSPAELASYLTHFRADAIVRDSELVRKALIGDTPWSLLGQSFGGFVAVTYLSFAPEGLREAFITGGLPSLAGGPDECYRITYPIVAERNIRHYERYPQDIGVARQVGRYLLAHDVRLPSGRPLTIEAFQSLGQMLGASTGSHALHYLLEDALSSGSAPSDAFFAQVDAKLSFAPGPLYALLHEPCVARAGEATRWSAQRILAEFPVFDARGALDGDDPVFFTGEMIYPWMVETDPVLQPLREVAEIIADYDAWPALYDPVRLARNEIPVAAAVYHDDMYVPRELSLPTAAAIRGLHPWVTNEYEHDGLRVSNGAVLDRVIELARGAR